MSKYKICDNELRIVAKYPLGDLSGENRKLEIKNVEYDYSTTLEKAFSIFPPYQNVYALFTYYEDYHWTCYGNACPYIISKDTVFWNVPYNQAKVVDFLYTHDIYDNIIEIDVDCLAGGGEFWDFLFQGWMICKIILEYAGYVYTFKGILDIIIKAFGKNKEKIPSFSTFEMFLLKEDCWNIKELSKQTRLPQRFLQNILEGLGFEEHEGKYYKNSWKVAEFQQEKENIDYNFYISKYNGFDVKIDENWTEKINTSLIYLYQLSYQVDNYKTYNEVEDKIKKMIAEDGHDEFYDDELDYIQTSIHSLEEKLGIS